MKITKNGMAGSLESSDCLVVLSPFESRNVVLNSVAEKRFGTHLHSLINEILDEFEVESGTIEITDRGALDYCIRARIACAIQRSLS